MFEGMIRTRVQERDRRRAAEPFPVMTYADAMRRYGSDKPDLRVKLELTELTDVMKDVDFKVFSGAGQRRRTAASSACACRAAAR